jgi:hypothetical protein
LLGSSSSAAAEVGIRGSGFGDLAIGAAGLRENSIAGNHRKGVGTEGGPTEEVGYAAGFPVAETPPVGGDILTTSGLGTRPVRGH